MKRWLISSSLLAVLALGCKSKPQDAEGSAPASAPAPAAPAPAAAAPAAGSAPAAAGAEPANGVQDAPAAPTAASAPAAIAPADTPDKPIEAAGTVALGAPSNAAPVPAGSDAVPLPTLPPPPEEAVMMVARQAATACTEGDTAPCPARLALAAKIPTDLDQTKELLAKGTDQEKAAIRAALLIVRDEAADPLIISLFINAAGATDREVLAHLGALRSPAAVPAIMARLSKAGGEEAIALIAALGRIGGDAAHTATGKLLEDKTFSPYWGEVCRTASRIVATAAFDKVVSIGTSLAATPTQADGCRNAEAAFRMLTSAGDLVVNSGGMQKAYGQAQVWQTADDPNHVRVVIPADPAATCASAGAPLATFRAPLDRKGAPILGEGLVADMRADDTDWGDAPVSLMRFDALELRKGAEMRGHVSAVHLKTTTAAHLIISGPITGTFCGVTPAGN